LKSYFASKERGLMQLTISHEPNYHSCWAVVDLNHSVREKLRPGEVLTTDKALEVLRRIKEESRSKENKWINLALVIYVLAPLIFCFVAIFLNLSLNILLIPLFTVSIALVSERLKLFPFSLIQAYQAQATEAEYGHIWKLKDKITYNITSDIVLL
jgi:hypothetical protein